MQFSNQMIWRKNVKNRIFPTLSRIAVDTSGRNISITPWNNDEILGTACNLSEIQFI
jgi:hypothetical protein